MNIRYHRKFEKQYVKLPEKTRKIVKTKIKRFFDNPNHPSLQNHQLQGVMSALRAFSITDDIRIIFQEFENYTFIIFLKIGTHDQVYE